MLDLIEKAIGWATITRSQDASGFVQVDAGDPKPIEKVIQLGLPGMYAKAAASVKGVIFRLLFGTLFVAADTPPPSDAVDAEVGWSVAGALFRLRPTPYLESKGLRAVNGVYIGNDTGLVGPFVMKYVAREDDLCKLPSNYLVGTISTLGLHMKVRG